MDIRRHCYDGLGSCFLGKRSILHRKRYVYRGAVGNDSYSTR